MIKRTRLIRNDEWKQRGCQWCEDSGGKRLCLHEWCPYGEMDGYKSYAEYLKKNGGGTVKQLLMTAARMK